MDSQEEQGSKDNNRNIMNKNYVGRGISKGHYYKHYKMIKPVQEEYNLSYKKYVDILEDLFEGLFDVIVKEGSINLPSKIGTLFLRRIETKPKIVDGKVRYVAPINWYETKKLWEEDKEARESKKLIKFPPGDVYQVKYIPNHSLGGKMKFYTFRLLRPIQRGKLKEIALKCKIEGIDYIRSKSVLKNQDK